MPYHVQLFRSDASRPDVLLDLDRRCLEQAVLAPYREGRAVFVHGGIVPAGGLARIKITWTEEKLTEVVSAAGRVHASSDGYRARAARIADTGADVTGTFVRSAPGVNGSRPPRAYQRRVFLVVGRWVAAREAMTAFLRSLDLDVVLWDDAVAATGHGSSYPAEILDAGFARCDVVVVFMTPDDLSTLHPALRLGPAERSLSGQARPNVIFEAGMAWQRSRQRTLIVTYGGLATFSDLNGVDRVRLDGSAESRHAVVARLKAMGVPVKDTGGWLTAGQFPPALPPPSAGELGVG
jgi:predicted nucleotide-binding protein